MYAITKAAHNGVAKPSPMKVIKSASPEQTFTIEKGVPLPAKKKRIITVRKYKYPFHDLQVSDSFLIPDKNVQNFYATVTSWNKKIKGSNKRYHKFKCYQEGTGVRVYRVA